VIEGVAEATASLLKVFSGWLSDRLRARKWLAVAGYGLSAVSKPFFYFANSWGAIAATRWADRAGKGSAPPARRTGGRQHRPAPAAWPLAFTAPLTLPGRCWG